MLNIINEDNLPTVTVECEECSNHFTTNKYDAQKSVLGGICSKCKEPIEELTQEQANKIFLYNESTGQLTAKVNRRGRLKGAVVGSLSKSTGYIELSISGKSYLAHRVIWLMKRGYYPEQIDHINHIRHDNSWSNLREVNNRINHLNTSLSKNTDTGFNGVSYMKSKSKYRAYIMINKKHIHLGLFADINEAISARKQADIDYGFHSNHGI